MNDSINLVALLGECADACGQCAAACLQEQDVNSLNHCIRLDLDCAETCQLTASFISRNSDQTRQILKECARICRNCAAECLKHAHMAHCATCADICTRCAEACESELTLF